MPSPSAPITTPSSFPNRSPTLTRHTIFQPSTSIVDEKLLTHNGTVKPHFAKPQLLCHQDNRHGCHRDPDNALHLTATLTHVHFGTYHSQPACVMAFNFQIEHDTSSTKSKHQPQAVEKVDIDITFSSTITPTSSQIGPHEEPTVLGFFPKHVASSSTAAAGYTASAQSLRDHHTPANSSGGANKVRFFFHRSSLDEDEDVKMDLRPPQPIDFHTAVIVAAPFQGRRPVQAVVDVKCGVVGELSARPWDADDPVSVVEGMEIGESVRLGDFAEMEDGEWEGLLERDRKAV